MKLRGDKKLLCSKVKLIVVEHRQLCLLQIRLSKRRFSLEKFERHTIPSADDFAAWAKAISAEFVRSSSFFQRGPILLILPHFSPSIRHVEIPAVLPRFQRETIGQAFEIEGALREKDYAWDYYPLDDDGSQFYVFGERRAILRPFLNLFLSTEICPDQAILPVFADFLGLASDGRAGHSLKVDISDDFTTLLFSGGDRVFMRYLDFGWNRLIQSLAREFGETEEEIRLRLEKFLNREAAATRREEIILQRGFRDFCSEIDGQIHRTELHYGTHLSGRRFGQIFWVSSLAHSQRLQDHWQEKYEITGTTFEVGRFLSIPRAMRKKVAPVGSATWLRIFHSVRHFAFVGFALPGPFIGEKLRARILRRQTRKLALESVSLVSLICLLGSFYRLGELKFLRAALDEKQSQSVRLQIRSQEFDRSQREAELMRQNFQLQNRVTERQNFLLRLFATLEWTLGAAGNCWLDRFNFPDGVRPVDASGEVSIGLTGRFFVEDPNNPEAMRLLGRQFESLLDNLSRLGFIRRMEQPSISPIRGNVAQFGLTIVVDAKEIL